MLNHLLFYCFTACLFVLLSSSAHGTRTLPPTLPEVVEGSRHIGLVKLRKSEVYDVVDAEGVIPCGIIYEGNWIEYCSALVALASTKSNHESVTNSPRHSFCEPKMGVTPQSQ